MSRDMKNMFPDVFAYPDTKHEMNLSSIYEKPERGKTQGKYPNSNSNTQSQTNYPQVFGEKTEKLHLNYPPQMKSSCVEESNSGNLPVTGVNLREWREETRDKEARECSLNTNNNGVILPPLRRVVKYAISSTQSTSIIATLAFVHTLTCLVVPLETSTLMATVWGSFLRIWLLITILQLISHSVYLCTSFTMIFSFVHFSFVVLTAISIPASLFDEHLWLAFFLCVVIVAYQSLLLCLVYTPEKKPWIYAIVGCFAVIIPLIQLVQIDSSNESMIVASFMWSAMSMFILYGFAFANSKRAVLVDVTVGASPTWQLQDE